MHLGFGEILVVLVIALLVFGPSKLPQLGDALGKGIRAFKKATTEDDPVEAPKQSANPPGLSAHASPASGPVAAETTAGEPQPASTRR